MSHKVSHSAAYFQWLLKQVYDEQSGTYSYYTLLSHLHMTQYRWTIDLDANRAADGIDLRKQFAYEHNIDYTDIDAAVYCGPCSVLEMLVALSIKIEDILSNPAYGRRTGLWFWSMITSLGLAHLTDGQFDIVTMRENLRRFFENKYWPNGVGGLFTINGCKVDLTGVDIYTQMYWYINATVPGEIAFNL